MSAEALAREAAETVARHSYGKLVALLAARTRDVAAAEDALSEAFASALAEWPRSGVPRTPEAWLLTAARRRLIDASRRRQTASEATSHLRLMSEEVEAALADESVVRDERLALMFACAHPALDPGIRAPLILQTVLGFDAATIGSCFLVSPATMSQRLVRAKHKIRDAGIRFSVPDGAELRERLSPVLEAIYAAFAEGWADPVGADARKHELAQEGIWLGRLVASLLPSEAEALALLALMLYAQARSQARRDADGAYVPLAEQDPALWDERMIREAEALLHRASELPGDTGRYQLEAAVQSAHVLRRRTGSTDWLAIERIYEALFALTGSPVVALNRAIASAETRGTAAGLASLDALASERRLADYQPYWAARADLLARADQREAADQAYQRAIGLERDPIVRDFLARRRAELHAAVQRVPPRSPRPSRER